MTDPFPAIVESEATGETAALFAELRAALGVPFVNLIWRHLATIPGGLPWTWSLLRPVYASPVLAAAAREQAAQIVLPCTPLPRFVYDGAGIGAEARAAIARLIADYNRGNGLNVLGMSLACRVLRGEHQVHPGAPAAPLPAALPPPVPGAPLPRLLGLEELPPALHDLVLDLDRFGRIAPSTAVASLYRHLAHWPGFLALAHTALAPLHRDATLRTEQEKLIARSGPVVMTRLEPLLQTVPPLPGPAERAHMLAGLDEFVRLMIGRMTVVGAALLALLPDEA